MTIPFRILVPALLSFSVLPLAAKPGDKKSGKTTETHNVSEWKLGNLLFGEAQTAETLKGKAVVIEAWGVKCPPCVESLPHMAKLDRKLRDKGLVLIGAECQNHSKAQIQPLVEKNKLQYTIVSGVTGPVKFDGIPHCFVFDREGKMIYEGHPADSGFERAVGAALRGGAKQEGRSSRLPEPAKPLVESSVWTNADGGSITATALSADATKVMFRMANGKEVSYPLEKLSDESRKRIADALAGRAKEADVGGE